MVGFGKLHGPQKLLIGITVGLYNPKQNRRGSMGRIAIIRPGTRGCTALTVIRHDSDSGIRFPEP